MLQLAVYLIFNGNCREAMQFYQDCLGGQLHLHLLGDSDFADDMPDAMKTLIAQATLQSEGIRLIGTDLCDTDNILPGNTLALWLKCSHPPELHTLHHKLSAGGRVTHAPASAEGGGFSGSLIDRYGHHWFLYTDQPI